MPERVEELAPQQAPAAPSATLAPEAPRPTGALPGGMSVQQLLGMQRGAGNAAVSSFVSGQRDGGGVAAPPRPKTAPGDDRIMSALAGAARGSAVTAAVAAENPDLAQKNGHSPDSAADEAKAKAKDTPPPAQPAAAEALKAEPAEMADQDGGAAGADAPAAEPAHKAPKPAKPAEAPAAAEADSADPKADADAVFMQATGGETAPQGAEEDMEDDGEDVVGDVKPPEPKQDNDEPAGEEAAPAAESAPAGPEKPAAASAPPTNPTPAQVPTPSPVAVPEAPTPAAPSAASPTLDAAAAGAGPVSAAATQGVPDLAAAANANGAAAAPPAPDLAAATNGAAPSATPEALAPAAAPAPPAPDLTVATNGAAPSATPEAAAPTPPAPVTTPDLAAAVPTATPEPSAPAAAPAPPAPVATPDLAAAANGAAPSAPARVATPAAAEATDALAGPAATSPGTAPADLDGLASGTDPLAGPEAAAPGAAPADPLAGPEAAAPAPAPTAAPAAAAAPLAVPEAAPREAADERDGGPKHEPAEHKREARDDDRDEHDGKDEDRGEAKHEGGEHEHGGGDHDKGDKDDKGEHDGKGGEDAQADGGHEGGEAEAAEDGGFEAELEDEADESEELSREDEAVLLAEGYTPEQIRESAEEAKAEERERKRSIKEGRAAVNQAIAEATQAETQKLKQAQQRTKQAISQATAKHQREVSEAGTQHMGTVRGAFAKAKGQVGAAVAGAKGKVSAAGATAKGQVTTWKSGATSKTKSAVDEAANAATQTGSDFANQGRSAVTASSQKVKGTIDSTAGAVQGQSGGGGGVNEAAAEGNAKVASKVSAETAGKVKSQGGQVVSGVQSQGGKVGSAFQAKGKEAATAIKSTLPDAMSNLTTIASQANSAVAKGVSSGQSALGQVGAQTNASLGAQQGAATKQIASTVASTKGALAKGAATANQAVGAQHAAALKGLKASAAKMRALVKRAPIMREDAAGVAGEVKGGLKEMTSRGIVAGGKTAKLATNATGGAAKQAKTGLASGAAGAAGSAAQTASGASTGASSLASNVGTQVQSTAKSATAAGDKTVTSYTGKVKQSKDKVKGKLSDGLNKTKTEMSAHEAKVQGGTGKIPGDNAGKVSEGQAKVNAAATKEPKKPSGLWGKVVSAAKWVAEKLKAAFEFVAKMLTDPGFWVSLIVAIALTAFVIATFGSGLAVLVVAGAVIGAISAGAGQIVTNLASGKKWNEGLGTAMLIGGVTGLIPGLGKGLGTIGSKVAGKFGTSVANSAVGRMGSKIASSALGKGVQALGRGIKNVGGKLATLGSKAGKTLPGKIVAAPFKAAEKLGTKLGNATRGALEKKFPGIKPKPPTTKPTTSAAREEPSTTGTKPEVTSDADTVAKSAQKKLDDIENPTAIRDRIDSSTGVKKGPEYEKAQKDLREFYENQQKEAFETAKDVNTYRKDPIVDPKGDPKGYYGIDSRFEAREFAYDGQNLTQVSMKVNLKPQPGVSADDIARVQADALKGVDEFYNGGHTLPNGNRLNVNVEFTDDAAASHLVVDVKPKSGGANQVEWYVDSNPTTHAHELGHQMGLLDEYYDPQAALRGGIDKATGKPNTSGIREDDSLMGDYWKRPPGGGAAEVDPVTGLPIHRPETHLKDRHLDQIGGDIDKAVPRVNKPGSGGGTSAPGARPKGPDELHPDEVRMLKQQQTAEDQLPGVLEKHGVADHPTFKDMDAQTKVKVNNAFGSDPMSKDAASREAAMKWALDGAKGNPREFANRYEYVKAKYTAFRNTAPEGVPPRVHARENFNLDDVKKDYKADVKASSELPEGQHIQLSENADVSEMATKVRDLDRIEYESSAAEAYHAVKHPELPSQQALGGDVKLTGDHLTDFLAVQRQTIKSGTVEGVTLQTSNSTKLVYTQTYDGTSYRAIVFVKPDGTVRVASFGAVGGH